MKSLRKVLVSAPSPVLAAWGGHESLRESISDLFAEDDVEINQLVGWTEDMAIGYSDYQDSHIRRWLNGNQIDLHIIFAETVNQVGFSLYKENSPQISSEFLGSVSKRNVPIVILDGTQFINEGGVSEAWVIEESDIVVNFSKFFQSTKLTDVNTFDNLFSTGWNKHCIAVRSNMAPTVSVASLKYTSVNDLAIKPVTRYISSGSARDVLLLRRKRVQ